MEKLTDNRTALTQFKRQGGFNISKGPSAPSDYLKINQFKKHLKPRKEWLIDELTVIYKKDAEGIFERFNGAIEKGNNVTVSIINKCEECGSILQEIIRRHETKNSRFFKR